VDVELTDLHSGFDVGHDDLLLVPINAVSCVPPHTGRSKRPVPCAATVAQTVTSSPSSIEHLPIPGMPTCWGAPNARSGRHCARGSVDIAHLPCEWLGPHLARPCSRSCRRCERRVRRCPDPTARPGPCTRRRGCSTRAGSVRRWVLGPWLCVRQRTTRQHRDRRVGSCGYQPCECSRATRSEFDQLATSASAAILRPR